MGRKSKYSKEIKIEIVKRYLHGESCRELARLYNIEGKHGEIRVAEWSKQYKTKGASVFDNRASNKKYSKELKIQAIEEYINGEGSLGTIANKYGILSTSTLRKWIRKYNRHIEIKDYDPKPEVYMSKSRRTTYNERIEIAEYCLSNSKNYKAAAIKYGVNYAQVYTWVRKYIEFGEEGLKDKRGRRKPNEELTEIEKLKLENKKLLARNKYLEMETEVLKKVEEIESEMVRGKTNKRNTEQ